MTKGQPKVCLIPIVIKGEKPLDGEQWYRRGRGRNISYTLITQGPGPHIEVTKSWGYWQGHIDGVRVTKCLDRDNALRITAKKAKEQTANVREEN